MTTEEAVTDLIQTAFIQFGGKGKTGVRVLREKKHDAVSKPFFQGSGQEKKELNKPLAINFNPRSGDPTRGGTGLLTSEETMFCLQTTPHFVTGGGGKECLAPNASDSARSTATRKPSTDTTGPITETSETQPGLFQQSCQTLTFSSRDFLARLSQLLDNDAVLMKPEALCFLRSHGFYHTKDPHIFYSKTFEVWCLTNPARLSTEYLGFSPTSIISWKSLYLIQKITGFAKTGSGPSLLDTLQTDVPKKYFLSKKAIAGILRRYQKDSLYEDEIKLYQDALTLAE